MYKSIITAIIASALTYSNAGAQTVYKSRPSNSNTVNRNNSSERDYSKFSTQNIIYSGNIGFSFSSDILNLGIGPIIGYKFNDYLSAGVRLSYNFFRWKDYNYFYDSNDNIIYKPLRNDIYQAGIWARFSPIDALYAHVEYENHLIVQKKYVYDMTSIYKKEKENFNVNALMVGLGYKQPLSERLSYCYTFLYDVLQNSEKNSFVDPSTGRRHSLSPYANSIDIRIGIFYNF